MVKEIQRIQVKASKLFVPLKNTRRDSSSSELSSTESFTSSSSELSSFTSITSCSCLTSSTDECDYLVYINKKEQKNGRNLTNENKKKLSKRRNPSKMSTTTLKKLGSKKNSKEKTHEVPKKNKKILENSCLSDSSNNCDCNSCYTHCDCKHYNGKNKQENLKNKNKRKKIMSSKSRGQFTKVATTSESLKNRKISKKDAIKSSEKKKTSLFDSYGCNCNSRNTKCAKGSSRSLRDWKKSVRNAKSLNSKKVSRKTESFERHSSSFSSEDTEYEFFSSDEDSRDHCCGNIRESRRKIKY
ncbi:male determiner protein Mdmd(V)-like [Camponotus floridanus]|uniref:male determiner protein Mdmd(V)-like n=1 Tax=Camponotus floridanus TaxID=104421 RepID=UPI00059DC194|nr:male determiner protein Mdmd(V)-like [Camponotus floridanus]